MLKIETTRAVRQAGWAACANGGLRFSVYAATSALDHACGDLLKYSRAPQPRCPGCPVPTLRIGSLVMFRGSQLELERLAMWRVRRSCPKVSGCGVSKDCKAEALSRILRSIALWITQLMRSRTTQLMRSPLRVTCEQSTHKT
jgi:hypothetical protein